MLGMNAEDVLGLAEDMAVLRGSQIRSSQQPESGSSSSMPAFAAGLKGLIDQYRAANRGLANRLASEEAEYCDLTAVLRASRKALDALIAELALTKGLSPEQLKTAVYKSMSIEYDRQIEEMLAGGAIKVDPRKNPEVLARPSRDWYTP